MRKDLSIICNICGKLFDKWEEFVDRVTPHGGTTLLNRAEPNSGSRSSLSIRLFYMLWLIYQRGYVLACVRPVPELAKVIIPPGPERPVGLDGHGM
jgi:hypothetical protein